MKTVMSALAIALLAAAGVAAAQEGPHAMGDLSRAQAQAKALEIFNRLDLNHDGKLDQADRALHVQKAFDRIDTDHNGQISPAEFAAAHAHGPGHPGGPGGPGGPDGMAPPPPADGKPGRWPHGPGGMHMGHGPTMMHMADANGDHAISKDEFIAAALKRFDAEDANHDGTVTPAERQAAHKAMRDKWRAMRGGQPGEAPPPPPPAA